MDYFESYEHEVPASGFARSNHSLALRACISRCGCHWLGPVLGVSNHRQKRHELNLISMLEAKESATTGWGQCHPIDHSKLKKPTTQQRKSLKNREAISLPALSGTQPARPVMPEFNLFRHHRVVESLARASCLYQLQTMTLKRI